MCMQCGAPTGWQVVMAHAGRLAARESTQRMTRPFRPGTPEEEH